MSSWFFSNRKYVWRFKRVLLNDWIVFLNLLICSMVENKQARYVVSAWEAALETIFQHHPSAKFAYTGRLDINDFTKVILNICTCGINYVNKFIFNFICFNTNDLPILVLIFAGFFFSKLFVIRYFFFLYRCYIFVTI